MTTAGEITMTFKCRKCGKSHPFTMYVLAHWGDCLLHTCDCGAQHSIRRGVAILLKKKNRRKKKP